MKTPTDISCMDSELHLLSGSCTCNVMDVSFGTGRDYREWTKTAPIGVTTLSIVGSPSSINYYYETVPLYTAYRVTFSGCVNEVIRLCYGPKAPVLA